MFTKDHLMNQLMNDEGVCRTASATPGQLKIYIFLIGLKVLIMLSEGVEIEGF